MYISTKDWQNYIDRLSALDQKAGDLMREWILKNGFSDTKAMTDYAFALAQKYGEGSAALSAEMYDAVAEMQGKLYPPAEAMPPPDYGEVAKTVNGILKHSQNPNSVANGVSRLVKRTGADTTLNNALRDGAEFAWVPNGDTCAFCIALASRGWQKISKKALKNGHAEHIHANCDCMYSVRFDGESGVKGYDPQKYKDMYYGAEGNTPKERINFLRRIHYEQNRELINARKRTLYEKARQLVFDENDKLSIQRGKEISARKAMDSKYGVYVSNEAVLKKQGLQNIEKAIEDSLRKLGVDTNAALPQIIILGDKEMGTAYAAYNFVDNRLFIRDSMGNKQKTKAYQYAFGFAAPYDPKSTTRHELIHWIDADEYRRTHGKITKNNYFEYLRFRNEQGKIKLGEAGISEKNVHRISRYAYEKYVLANEYDEAYTEYRVLNGR